MSNFQMTALEIEDYGQAWDEYLAELEAADAAYVYPEDYNSQLQAHNQACAIATAAQDLGQWVTDFLAQISFEAEFLSAPEPVVYRRLTSYSGPYVD